jgi:hypothetical protein
MAKQSNKAAAPVAAASPPSPPPAAPPAGPAQEASEATASSNGASDTAAAGAGDLAPTGSGQADLNEPNFVAAHEALRQALHETGEPLKILPATVGVDLSSQPDRTAWYLEGDGVDLHRPVLELGDGQQLTMGEFFDLPWRHQADVIAMLVDAAAWASADADELVNGQVMTPGLAEADEGFVWVTAKSRDGKPYRRAGVAWDGDFNPHQVATDQLEKLFADRHLIFRD